MMPTLALTAEPQSIRSCKSVSEKPGASRIACSTNSHRSRCRRQPATHRRVAPCPSLQGSLSLSPRPRSELHLSSTVWKEIENYIYYSGQSEFYSVSPYFFLAQAKLYFKRVSYLFFFLFPPQLFTVHMFKMWSVTEMESVPGITNILCIVRKNTIVTWREGALRCNAKLFAIRSSFRTQNSKIL